MGFESIQPPKPFQAEYEGSIPFTRSNTSHLLSYQSRSDSICPNENAVSVFALSLFVNNGESFGSGSRVTAGSGILPARRQRFDLWARPNVGCPAIHRPE
jgi:hypothetical protein